MRGRRCAKRQDRSDRAHQCANARRERTKCRYGRPGLARLSPSWYQLAQHDNAISPQAQQFMAKRMGSATEEIDGSHTAFIAQPVRAAQLIKAAITQS